MNKAMWQEEAETKLLHGWLSLSPSTSWLYLQQPETQPGGRRRENSQSGQTGSWDRQQRPCFLKNSVAGMVLPLHWISASLVYVPGPSSLKNKIKFLKKEKKFPLLLLCPELLPSSA